NSWRARSGAAVCADPQGIRRGRGAAGRRADAEGGAEVARRRAAVVPRQGDAGGDRRGPGVAVQEGLSVGLAVAGRDDDAMVPEALDRRRPGEARELPGELVQASDLDKTERAARVLAVDLETERHGAAGREVVADALTLADERRRRVVPDRAAVVSRTGDARDDQGKPEERPRRADAAFQCRRHCTRVTAFVGVWQRRRAPGAVPKTSPTPR